MEHVGLGKSGLRVSSLAFGTDLIGSKIDEGTSFQLLDYFEEHGGNFIDTANMYACWLPGCHGGESEKAIGKWMKSRGNRSRMVISTKLAFDFEDCSGGLSAAEIERECERSLRKLQTDTIDIYFSHRDDRQTPLEETMEAFHRLVKAGKIRAIGASNLFVWRIAEANMLSALRGWTEYCAIEQRYTYLRPRYGADFGPQIFIGDELKEYAKAHGTALIAYSILLRGAYTRSDRELPTQFAGPDSEARLKVLREVADEAGCSPNDVVIAWMRQSSPSILPIVAASRVEQLAENIDALKIKLSEQQMQQLDTAGNAVIAQAWLQPT